MDWQTKYFLSGAADNTIRLWDVSNGKMLEQIETKSAVRTCKFSYSGNLVAFTTDKTMGQPCVIHIVDVRCFGKGGKLCYAYIGSKAFTSLLEDLC